MLPLGYQRKKKTQVLSFCHTAMQANNTQNVGQEKAQRNPRLEQTVIHLFNTVLV